MSFGKTNYRNGGTRGGADQFKWDDVKNDKYRENYLGHSLHAPVGRWQKGKDLTWYNKLSREDRAAALKAEIALAKQRDQELMDQALGIAPKRRVEPTGALEAAEVKELLKRGASDREGLDGERVEGVGAAPAPSGYDTRPKKTMAEKYEESLAKGEGEGNIYALPGAGAVNGASDTMSGDDAARREEKARKKAAKKLLKKEKKEKKKERKERRRRDADQERESERRGRDRERDRERSFSPHSRRRRDDDKRSSRTRSLSSSRSRSPSESRVTRRADRRRSRSPSADHYRRRSRSRSFHRDDRHQSRSRSRSRPSRDRRRSRSPSRSRTRSRSRSHSRRR